ncbi:MAG: asparagine synthase-related protein [Vicinamibacterales bacterium]
MTRRKKAGIPMKNWLRRELQPLMQRLLAPDRLQARGLFDPAEVQRLMNEHVAGRENHAHALPADGVRKVGGGISVKEHGPAFGPGDLNPPSAGGGAGA